MRRGRGLSVAVAGLTALAIGTLGFTSAAGAAGARLPTRPLTINAAGSSVYLAGYQIAPTGGLASASDTFTVPTITCTAKDDSTGAAQWDGVYTDTLQAYALVLTECTSTGPRYDWEFATNAGTFDEPGAKAGDVIVASLFQGASSTFAEIHDLTQSVYWFADNSVNQGDTTVDIGTLNGTFEGLLVPTYSKIKFLNATVNGDYLGFDGPSQFNTLNGGDLVVKTGALKTTGTGSTFSTTWKRAS
jgi:hypothetical protein